MQSLSYLSMNANSQSSAHLILAMLIVLGGVSPDAIHVVVYAEHCVVYTPDLPNRRGCYDKDFTGSDTVDRCGSWGWLCQCRIFTGWRPGPWRRARPSGHANHYDDNRF